MLTIADHFENFTDLGLKVIPLRVNSKAPIAKSWQKKWDYNKNKSLFDRFPNSNIGLLLGDVIDVEGDSEQANRKLIEIIGDYPHPSYRSIRSVHHLFKTPDPNLRIFKHKEIEFRSTGHQSMLPPSKILGVEYSWITKLMPIPEMPESLMRFYHQLNGEKKSELKPNHIKVWCSDCNAEVYLHEKRFDLELKAFKLLHCAWKCKNCRVMDIRPVVKTIRNR